MKLYVTQFFMKIPKLAFIYKKHDTLHYVTFLYTKSWTLRKKKDNLRYVFIYKKSGHFTLRDFSLNFWNWRKGGTFLYAKNKSLCVIFLYAKKSTLHYVFIYKKPDTLRYIFISENIITKSKKGRHVHVAFFLQLNTP